MMMITNDKTVLKQPVSKVKEVAQISQTPHIQGKKWIKSNQWTSMY